jgi:hypothetical protein
MQTSGIPSRIQVVESTMQLASDRYRFTERLVDVKGLGELKAYLLGEGGW